MPILCLLVLGSRDIIFSFLAFFFSLSGCVIYSIHSVISQDQGGHQYSRRITLNAEHWLLFFFFWLLRAALLFSHVWFFVTLWTAERRAAYGILVAWPGIKPMPPAVESQSLNHWTARGVSRNSLNQRDKKYALRCSHYTGEKEKKNIISSDCNINSYRFFFNLC